MQQYNLSVGIVANKNQDTDKKDLAQIVLKNYDGEQIMEFFRENKKKKLEDEIKKDTNSNEPSKQYHKPIILQDDYPNTILGQMQRKNDLLNNSNVYKELDSKLSIEKAKIDVAYKLALIEIVQEKNDINLMNFLKHNENVEIKKDDYLFNSLGFKYKKDEQGNFIKDKEGKLVKEPLRDSSGAQVSPREAKALNNAEYANFKAIENQTDFTELIDLKKELEDEENQLLKLDEENNILTQVLKDFKNLDITRIEEYDNNKEVK